MGVPFSGVVKNVECENGPGPTTVAARTRNLYTELGAKQWKQEYHIITYTGQPVKISVAVFILTQFCQCGCSLHSMDGDVTVDVCLSSQCTLHPHRTGLPLMASRTP